MGRLFGTDGVRGVANKDGELTPELAFKIGKAGAYVLTETCGDKPRILVGKDTRISGGILESALVAGICSVGAEAVLAGVIPTPAIAHLVRSEGFDAGVMISASHNPFEHNGIKYIKFAETTCDTVFDGIKIAIDCANGASSVTAKKALEELGAEVCVINDSPNGININENCGSTHLENLAAFVTECGADVGLAFDGDADRVLAIDENGQIVDGDKIMTVIGLDMKKNGKLPDNTIVATVMSNLGFFVMGEENGINIKRTKVGDRYVLEEMLKNNHLIGGEQSGHVILLEHNTTGDGLVTGIQLVSVLKHSGKRMSELASAMQVYPQVLINASVKNELKNEENYMKFPEIKQAIEALENEFKDTGRVLIRPSGTEPLVRVMIEGKDENLIEKRARELANLFEAKLN